MEAAVEELRWRVAKARRQLPAGTMEFAGGLSLGFALAAIPAFGGARVLMRERAQLTKAANAAGLTVRKAEADIESVRRIATRDVADAKNFGTKRFAMAMLDVADSLRLARASAVSSGEAGPLVDGYGLVEAQLEKALGTQSVRSFGAAGDAFDPGRHEAIAVVHAPDGGAVPVGGAMPGPLFVAQVMQMGFMLNDRVVRAATVITTPDAGFVLGAADYRKSVASTTAAALKTAEAAAAEAARRKNRFLKGPKVKKGKH
mmetsp:Transcript_29255/g.101041  ORF Transcript_29255/g.101041 Transcript_29255/m.101041 type:complete len:259 (-) Transcript_29255:1135-1911(-)